MYELAAKLQWDPKLHLIDRVAKLLDIADTLDNNEIVSKLKKEIVLFQILSDETIDPAVIPDSTTSTITDRSGLH